MDIIRSEFDLQVSPDTDGICSVRFSDGAVGLSCEETAKAAQPCAELGRGPDGLDLLQGRAREEWVRNLVGKTNLRSDNRSLTVAATARSASRKTGGSRLLARKLRSPLRSRATLLPCAQRSACAFDAGRRPSGKKTITSMSF